MSRQALKLHVFAAVIAISACSSLRAEPPTEPAVIQPAPAARILPARDPERPCAVLEAGLPLPSITSKAWERFFELFHFEMNLLLPPREY